MKNIEAFSLRYLDGRLSVLDQQMLPHQEIWHSIETTEQMIEMIISLKVRGAPLIGLAACLTLVHEISKGVTPEQFFVHLEALRSSRPTAVNLANYLDRLKRTVAEHGFSAARIESEVAAIFDEDRDMCLKMSKFGAELIDAGDRVLTHCNTGSLATAGIGTALGVIKMGAQQKKVAHVYVDETRPLLQGGRLTTYELKKENIEHTLICDSMAAALMQQGLVQKVFVGADRIAANGDTANKIGTYALALAAFYHRVPFYVVAPSTTLDLQCPTGQHIPIEERKAEEVLGVKTSAGEVLWAPVGTQVYNPAFDVTPIEFITGIVLDSGVYLQSAVQAGQLKQLRVR